MGEIEAQENTVTAEGTNDASNFPPPPTSLSDNLSPICELPSTTFGFSLADLVDSILKDDGLDIHEVDASVVVINFQQFFLHLKAF